MVFEKHFAKIFFYFYGQENLKRVSEVCAYFGFSNSVFGYLDMR